MSMVEMCDSRSMKQERDSRREKRNIAATNKIQKKKGIHTKWVGVVCINVYINIIISILYMYQRDIKRDTNNMNLFTICYN